MLNFIAGGAGFIGSNLANHLITKGERVVVFDDFSIGEPSVLDNDVEIVVGDVRNLNSLEGFLSNRKFDRYFFLSGIVSTKDFIKFPKKTFDITFDGAKNIARFAIRDKARMIFFSTSEVYGNAKAKETDPFKCSLSKREGYDIGKIAAEAYLDILARQHLLRLTVIRPFNVYGIYEFRDGVVPKFVWYALNGKDLPIYNGGEQVRTFTYIDDFLCGLDLVKDTDGIFNIAGNDTITIRQLADIVIDEVFKKTGVKVGLKFIEKNLDEVFYRVPDISKIEELGYVPSVNIREGVRRVVDWIAQQKNFRIRRY